MSFGKFRKFILAKKKFDFFLTFSMCRPNPCAYGPDFFYFREIWKMSILSRKFGSFQNRPEMRSDEMFGFPTRLEWKKNDLFWKIRISTFWKISHDRLPIAPYRGFWRLDSIFALWKCMNFAFKSAENCQFFIFRKNIPNLASYFKMSKKTHFWPNLSSFDDRALKTTLIPI